MDKLHDLKDKLCEELEEIARKPDMGPGDLELIHKLTDTIKNIGKIEMLEEEGGYSESHYNLAFTGFIDNSSSKLVCYVGANDIAYESSVTDVFKAIMSNAVEQYNVVTE